MHYTDLLTLVLLLKFLCRSSCSIQFLLSCMATTSAKGQLYIWGRGFSGAADSHIPRCVTPHFLFSQAALGWNHILLLSVDGKVFMIGCYGHGILSGPQIVAEQEPDKDDNVRCIHGLIGAEVLQIAAGAEHSALVTDDGSVMTWGWGEHGQLGLGDATNQTSPHTVCFNKPLAKQHLVPRVFCGSGFTCVVRSPGSDSKI